MKANRQQRRANERKFQNPSFFPAYQKGFIDGVDQTIQTMSKAIDKAIKTTPGIGEKRYQEIMKRMDAIMKSLAKGD